jgi:hypothetical protein
MKIYLILFLLLEASVLASNISKKETPKSKFKDTAIFKIEEQVYYLSDINKSLEDIRVFRCLKSNSLLINSLKISDREYESFSDLTSDYSVLNRRQEQIEKIMILEKMLMYSVPLRIQVSEDDLTRIGFNKCFKGKQLSNHLKLMIKSEFHLRDRFIRNRKNLKIDDNLLEKLRIFYSGIDRKLNGHVYFR